VRAVCGANWALQRGNTSSRLGSRNPRLGVLGWDSELAFQRLYFNNTGRKIAALDKAMSFRNGRVIAALLRKQFAPFRAFSWLSPLRLLSACILALTASPLSAKTSPTLLEKVDQPWKIAVLQERWWFGPAVVGLFLVMAALAVTAAIARRKLAGYASHLKEKVFERTAEMTKANILLEARGKELLAELSERKSAEEALRVSEQRYRDLVENANDIIYTHDLAGNFTSLNRRGEQLTGYSRDEALRLNVSAIASPEQLAIARKMTEAKILGGPEVISTYALEILAKDGRRVMLEVSSRLLYDQGKPVGVEGIGRDITDRKMLEEELRQAQKIEAIGRLAGGVAHDFNNLLTAILGHSELLLATPTLERSVREDIEEIKKAGDRAASLTQQLLAFSRKQILEPKVLDLNAVVIGMEKLLLRLIGENVRLGTHTSALLGRVKADQSQLEQVILNLAINARDAMPKGGFLTWPSVTTDTAWTRKQEHTSLSHSSRPRKWAKGPAWRCRQSMGSSNRVTATSGCIANPITARLSRSICRASIPWTSTSRRCWLQPRQRAATRRSWWWKMRPQCGIW